MRFRYDIGVLRAIAVLSVLLFHFRVPSFEGGFTGVDVFFVISGFLMTKIILSSFDKNNFSLLSFYNKRVKRIIPVLLVVVLIVLVFSVFFFFNSDLRQNSKNAFFSSIFLSNIFYWLFSGYFDPESQNNIFLHSWSLSVEWQFYMIYPLLLIGVRKAYLKSKSMFSSALLIFTLLSFGFCLWIVVKDSDFAFYMIPSRAWEMTLGGLAFLYSDKLKRITNSLWSNVIVLLSYVVILLCNFVMNESILWPSSYTLVPTIATFLILTYDLEYGLLKNNVLQFFGNISYSLYLWHWPVFIGFKYFGFLNWKSVILMTIISTLLAFLTFKYVESNKKFSNSKFVFITIPIILLFSGIIFKYPNNYVTQNFKVYSNELTEIGNFTYDYANDNRLKQYNSCNCFLTSNSDYKIYNPEKCFKISTDNKNILLLGDSHSAQFSYSMRNKLPENYNLLEVSAGFTMPFKNPKGRKESVDLINSFYNDFMSDKEVEIDYAFVSVHWLSHNRGSVNYSREELKENILELIKFLEDRNIKTYILGQSEVYSLEFPRIVVINKLFGNPYSDYFDVDSYEINEYLKTFIPQKNFVDIQNLNDVNKFDDNTDMPYMMDDNHFTIYGSDQIVDFLLEKYNLVD